MSDQWQPSSGPDQVGMGEPSTSPGTVETSASTWSTRQTADATPKVPIEEMPTWGSRIGVFLDGLASDAPTPGGGAWAALSAAAGAALIAMVARLTIKKKGFEHVADRMREIAEECDEERYVLLGLADKDAAAYQAVMAAYKLPKQTPGEQHTWSTTLQKALEHAADVPLEVARRSVYLMALAEEAVNSGNPNAASDALCAATSLHAAALSALANVDINAITFIDKTRQQELTESANSLRHRAQSLLRDVSEAFFIVLHS